MAGAPLVVHERVEMLYRRHSLQPENVITCNDIRLIKSLIKQGSGISILSLLDVMDEVDRGALCFVPLRDSSVRPLTLALYCAPARQLLRAAQQVIQHLTQVIESLAATRSAPLFALKSTESVPAAHFL